MALMIGKSEIVRILATGSKVIGVLGAALLATAAAAPDGADPITGTLDATSQRRLSQGKLNGCEIDFDIVTQDQAYWHGGYIKVSGSVGLVAGHHTDRMGSYIHLVVNTLDRQSGALTPSPPSRAYVIGSDSVSNEHSLIKSGASDKPGGWFAISQLSPTMEIIFDAMKHNKLLIAFNQQEGKTDIALPVELDVVSTNPNGTKVRSGKTETEYAACVSDLIDQAQRQK
jgi:hypothetical protein